MQHASLLRAQALLFPAGWIRWRFPRRAAPFSTVERGAPSASPASFSLRAITFNRGRRAAPFAAMPTVLHELRLSRRAKRHAA